MRLAASAWDASPGPPRKGASGATSALGVSGSAPPFDMPRGVPTGYAPTAAHVEPARAARNAVHAQRVRPRTVPSSDVAPTRVGSVVAASQQSPIANSARCTSQPRSRQHLDTRLARAVVEDPMPIEDDDDMTEAERRERLEYLDEARRELIDDKDERFPGWRR